MTLLRDLSLSSASAGFVAVLVGFSSSLAIVYAAAQGLGADQAVVASWIWALGIGAGLTTLLPSLWWKKPVLTAWSTPGAAMLAATAASGGWTLPEATGAFLFSAALVVLVGASGGFEKLTTRIPGSLAAALLAGVLARFALNGFAAAQSAPVLVVAMLAVFVGAQRLSVRYAVPLTLLAGCGVAWAQGLLSLQGVQWELAQPVWTSPVWHWQALLSLGLPLFVVTMASQNLPGLVALRSAGYAGPTTPGAAPGVPVGRVVTLTGVATLALAPFGGFALNLAAITAALCMSREAHPDPARRYTAAVVCGLLYLLAGSFGGSLAALLAALPAALIAAIAGLALLGTIGHALQGALAAEQERLPAVLTFLVTLSGVTLGGIGAAFWGVVAGMLALWWIKD